MTAMHTREQFLKRLRDSEMYRAALGGARSDAEREAISGLVEGLVGAVGEILGPTIERAGRDPLFAEQLAMALEAGEHVTVEPAGEERVLTNEGPATSGSIG